MASSKKSVTFVSPYENFLQILEPGDLIRNERGRVVKKYRGRQVQFERNTANVDADTAKELRDLDNFNIDFWEVGNAPDEPKPTVQEQMKKITAAVGKKDPDALQTVLVEEEANHNRLAVTESARDALSILAGGPDPEPEGGLGQSYREAAPHPGHGESVPDPAPKTQTVSANETGEGDRAIRESRQDGGEPKAAPDLKEIDVIGDPDDPGYDKRADEVEKVVVPDDNKRDVGKGVREQTESDQKVVRGQRTTGNARQTSKRSAPSKTKK